MNPKDHRLAWVQRYADGLASAEEVAQLQAALREDAELRRSFLDYVNLDSALEATAAGRATAVVEFGDRVVHVSRRRFHWPHWLAVTAALVVLGVGAAKWWQRPAGVTVEVIQSEGARFGTSAEPLRVGTRLSLDRVELRSGEVSLRLSSGVVLKMTAPLEARFETPMRLRMVHGRLSADVGAHGIGFTVVTDAGEVVDLGTSFGVEAERGGESRVAVFSGLVKVRRGTADEGHAFTTLSEGEAVRFSAVAGLRRWQHVAMAAGAAGVSARSGTAVVGGVCDNLSEDELHPFYGVVSGGLRPGSLAFTDKPNPRWAPQPGDSIPPWLDGADLVRTYHQFRHRKDYELVLTLRAAATVFVLVDVRQPAPGWLVERFYDSGARVRVGPWQPAMIGEPGTEVRSDGLPYLAFAVWQADAGPGEFRLGAPRDTDHKDPALMYGVAVKARANAAAVSPP